MPTAEKEIGKRRWNAMRRPLNWTPKVLRFMRGRCSTASWASTLRMPLILEKQITAHWRTVFALVASKENSSATHAVATPQRKYCPRQHIKKEVMNKIKGAVVINTDRCKGCDLCVVACPYDVLELARKKVNASGYAYAQAVKAGACVGCAACGTVCPDGCITVYRMKVKENSDGRA